MKTNKTAAMSKNKKTEAAEKAEVIYLGIDAHLEKYVVVRQLDALTPQPAQSFRKEATLCNWVVKQQKQAKRVVCCYEAGPMGFILYRSLTELGVTCYVVAPKRWAENEDRVKTDKRDAKILCQRVESYDRGNHSVLNVLRVPSKEEEHRRALGRQREALKKEMMRNAQRGRGQALAQEGIRLKGKWWKQKRWEELKEECPTMFQLLSPLRKVILVIEEQLLEMTQLLEQDSVAQKDRPKGLGALTWRMIKGEVCDFARFNNRREVASYTGLCPSETSSGSKRRQGSVTKHGNRALRHYLVEAAWRLIKWQPDWYAWAKWKDTFVKASPGRRKQIIVALARTLAIDLWRLYTNQTTLKNLGLEPA